jgi:hypothetical protein
MDTFWAVIIGLHLIPIFGTVAGWHHETAWLNRIRASAGLCPSCQHPEHWPWCKVTMASGAMCWCDLFTEPED